MKLKTKLLGSLALLSAVGLSGNAMADCPSVLSLPAVAPNGQSVTFGDAVSYSLPILGIDVQSSPGQIRDCIVVATGAGGNFFNNNLASMDNPFATPTGVAGSTYFKMGDVANGTPDPTGGTALGTADRATSWDTSIAALKSYLNGNDMVVYFNHNQTNSGGAINQDVFVWAQFTLVNSADPTKNMYFYATSVPNFTGLQNFGQPGGNVLAYTGPQSFPTSTYPTGADGTCSATPVSSTGTFPSGDVGTGTGNGDACYMIHSLGQICLNGPIGVGTPIPCTLPGGAPNPAVVATSNDNLGADHVANAVVFPEINAILDLVGSGGFDVLSIDLRMGCNAANIAGNALTTAGVCPAGSPLNNGYEQVFIGRLSPTVCTTNCGFIPEPATVALFGLGLLGLGAMVRRRKI